MAKAKLDFEIVRSWYSKYDDLYHVTVADKRQHRTFFELIEMSFNSAPDIDTIRKEIQRKDAAKSGMEQKTQDAAKLLEQEFDL